VQVVFVGLFSVVVTNCLKILDCDEDVLILDPSLKCPHDGARDGGDIVPALVGLFIFVAYAILPLVRLTILSNRMDYDDIMAKSRESTSFRVKYAWAFKKYRKSGSEIDCVESVKRFLRLPPENWESFNMFVKIITVMSSVVMYSDNRRVAQLCITTLSLVLHAAIRPYKDNAGNITVVLFCLCDILGIFATSSLIAQILFIASLFLTSAVVIYFASKAARGRIRDIEMAAKNSASDDQASQKNKYSPLERKLLFPVLAVVWLASTVMMALCQIGRAKQSQTSVVPRETAALERAADAQQQADTLVENRDAAQKLREIREAHGADSEAYQAERETVLRSMVNTASTENSGNKNKKHHHHKHHHKKHHHKKHNNKSSSNQNF